jgi:cell division protease FtsH
MILLIGAWIFFMRQMQGGGGKAMSLQVQAKLLTENQHRVTFKTWPGSTRPRDEVEEIIDFLKDPEEVHEARRQDPRRCSWSALLEPARHCWPRP